LTAISERFRRNYAPAFLQFLSQRSEAALAAAYELGRNAMLSELSMLELVQIHHDLLLQALKTSRNDEELENVALAASEFLVEVLATFEMAQRSFLEAHQAVAVDREADPPQRASQQSITEQAAQRRSPGPTSPRQRGNGPRPE
jgi:predicted unusual protein kinase regulating ubiquinone biosynthesis (AarF/ABC1/UbiB family)